MMFRIDQLTARAIKKYPHRALDIVQSLDEKQVRCKEWLIEELDKLDLDLGWNSRIWIAGGWFGNLMIPSLRQLYGHEPVIRLHDLDEEVLQISREILLNKYHWPNTHFDHQDCTKFQYKKDLLINTSCEHMPPLNYGKAICVLQSNNYYTVPEHTHCVDSAEQLAHEWGINRILYKGEMQFENYARFMVIGRRKENEDEEINENQE